MRGRSTVSVDDYLAAGKSCISSRSSQRPDTRGVENETSLFVNEVLRKNLIQDFFLNGCSEVFERSRGIELRANEDIVNAFWDDLLPFLSILESDLAFAVGSQEPKFSILSQLG